MSNITIRKIEFCPQCGGDHIVTEHDEHGGYPMCLKYGNTYFDSSEEKEVDKHELME